MKICRFMLPEENLPRLGLVNGEAIHDVTDVTRELPAVTWPLPREDLFLASLPRLRPLIEQAAKSSPALPRAAVKLLSPVANPGKFICGVGNWKHHGAPLGVLGFLFKATSAMAGADEGVHIRWTSRTTLHEPELAIVIGRTCSNVSEAEALDYVAGYTGGMDMTMKEQKEFFCFCKSFDSYGVLGPWLVTGDEIPDPSSLAYEFRVNGELRGQRAFGDLTGSPAQLVAFASSAMTLYPGDVIFSGAADVAPVMPGDVMSLDIPRIGRMDISVSASPLAQ